VYGWVKGALGQGVPGWVKGRYHNVHGPSSWFRAKYGKQLVFISANNEKNESQPVLDIQQFDLESYALQAVEDARAYWGTRASVRTHKRVTRVDSIELARWFVIVRAKSALIASRAPAVKGVTP
jgi:hypothetical protein